MKKWISLILTMALLANLLPASALAAEDTYSLTDGEVAEIVALAGLDDVYREGMSYSSVMSAYQKYCFLQDFRDDDLAKVKSQCSSLQLELEEKPDDSLSEKYREAKRAVNDLDQLLEYWCFDLDAELQAVRASEQTVKSEDAAQEEKAKAYRRLSKAKKRLGELEDELAENDPSALSAQTDELFRQLSEIHEAHEADQAANEKPALLQASGQGSEFHFVILNANQIGLEVHTEDGLPVAGASVTLKSGETTKTITTGADGGAIFESGCFALDDHNRMWGELRITKDGMRTYESHAMRFVGGDGVKIILEPDDGEPYVQYMTFRGVDVLHDTETVYYTPVNNAEQSFKVGIHTKPGKSGSFHIEYIDAATGETKSVDADVAGTSDEVKVLDFADEWCCKLAPEQKVSMTLCDSAEETTFTRDCGIMTEEAVVKAPLKTVPFKQEVLPGLGFELNFPTGLPVFSNLKIRLALPNELFGLLPVTFSMTTSGDFVLGVAFSAAKKISDDATADKWKVENSKDSRERMCDFLAGRTSMTDIAKTSAKNRGAALSGWDLMGLKTTFSVSALLTGTISKEERSKSGGPYKGSLDLFIAAALDATVSFTEPYFAGPVPCTLGFDFNMGVMAGIDIPFEFTTPSTSTITFAEWENFKFQKDRLDILISPRVSINGYAGIGIKGLCGLYLKGYVGAAMAIHIRPMNDQVMDASVRLTAGLALVAEFLFWSVSATIIEGTWQEPDPKKSVRLTAGANDAEDDETRYVEAVVRDLAELQGATEIKTVACDLGFYVFYVADTNVNGVVRPWLNCKLVEPSKMGGSVVTDQPLTDLGIDTFVVSQELSGIPDDAFVVNYDVASFDDLAPEDCNVQMLALQVIFDRTDDLSDDIPRFLVANRNYQEAYYLYRESGSAFKHYAMNMGNMTYRHEDEEVTGLSVTFDANRNNEPGDDLFFYLTTAHMTSYYPRSVDYSYQEIRLSYDRSSGQYTVTFGGSARQSTVSVSGMDYNKILQFEIHRYNERCSNLYALCENWDGSGTTLICKPVIAGLDQDVSSKLSGDILSFQTIPNKGKAGDIVTMVSDKDEAGRYKLSVCPCDPVGDAVYPTLSEPRDVSVRVGPANFSLVDLGSSRALYYLEETVTDNDLSRGCYAIKAVYLAESADGSLFASKPFHLAVFTPESLDIQKGATGFQLYYSGEGFLQGFVYERTAASENEKRSRMKYFSFYQRMQADVRDVVVEDLLTKPGETVNLLFSLMNSGNIPASKVSLSAYAVRQGSSEKIRLSNIVIDCQNPYDSRLIEYDTDGKVIGSTNGLRAVSQYDSDVEDEMDQWVVGTSADDTKVYATSVLMPDETHIYRTQMIVPDDFAPGEYTVYVAPDQISTITIRGKDGRLDATSAWVTTLVDQDEPVNRRPLMKVAAPRTVTVTATINDWDGPQLVQAAPAGNPNGTVPVRLLAEGLALAPEEGTAVLSAFDSTTLPDREELDLDYADLSITARLTQEAGTEMVHIVVRNETASPMKGILLNADVDGADSFAYDFGGTELIYKQTASMDIPLEKLTGGREGERLNLRVAGTGSETNEYNNVAALPLQNSFMITKQPENQFATAGGSASFDVAARGGTEPYSYQWQVSTDGQNGTFRDIPGATEQVLATDDVKAEYNGAYFRCVIRDSDGETLTSDAALLLVSGMPVTGDASEPWAYGLAALLSLAVLFALLRRRKKAVR